VPESVAAYAAEFAIEVLAADAATASIYYAAAYATTVAASIYMVSDQQRRAANAQKDAYNASLRDRYVMSRSTLAPRQLVLGRQRVSGPIFYIGSYGTNKEHLVACVALAAHEIDAVEAIYFNDEQVVIDGSGNVINILRREQFGISGATASFTLTTEPAVGTVTAIADYGATQVTLGTTVTVSGGVPTLAVTGGTVGQTATVRVAYQPKTSPFGNTAQKELTDTFAIDGSGNGSIALPAGYIAGTARVTHIASGDSVDPMDAYATVSGGTLTVTGYPLPSITATVNWTVTVGSATLCRIKTHLGGAGQVADADMIAALPGVWTSAHTASGIAYLRIECDYDTTAFPSGLPNVSATVRGAKVYDPRTTLTAWSENPALLARHAATSPLCGRLSSTLVNDTTVIAAANVCDTLTTYVVNGKSYTRPLYTAGAAVKSGTRCQDVLNDLCQAMAGRWAFTDGMLRMKAGAWTTPLQTITESWLSDASAIHIQPTPNRQALYNVVTGAFADETRDYRVLPFARVEASAYITADGAELPFDITLNSVTHTGQAQQVVAVGMRDARQGLRVSLTCKMHAFAVEVFDNVYVTLSRFGWVNKTFEVIEAGWSIDGGITLTLKETDSSIYALGSAFSDIDPAPNTRLATPAVVPAVGTVTCSSGTSVLIKQPDGTILSRILVQWPTPTDPQVLESGGVEVRYGLAGVDESGWMSIFCSGAQAQTYITGVRDGTIYGVKARAYNSIAQGAWSAPVAHKVVGKTAPPSNVASASYSLLGFYTVRATWPAVTDVDLLGYEVRTGGSSWETSTLVGTTDAPALQFASSPGTQTLWVKAFDTTGNYSAVAASVSVTIPIAAAPTGLTYTAERYGVRLNCAASTDAAIARYEWRVGSSWAAATLIGADAGTALLWGVQTSGSYTVWVSVVDTFGNYSAPSSMTVVVASATAAFSAANIVSLDLVLDYYGTPGSFAIASYEIRYGDVWASATTVGSFQVTRHSRRIDWGGARRWWVCPIDVAGNYGTPSSVDTYVTTPGAVTSTRSEVVDNNALLYWGAPATGSLPVDRYEVRKGSTWAGGAVVGSNGNSTFTAIFEQQAGVYTYWVAAYDSAGSIGTPVGITATINQPPDYILRTQLNSTFTGTLTNLYVENGLLIGPANTSESFATHFTSNSWASPQDQINAGYPLYIEPGLASATYDESWDYGAALGATTITVTVGTTPIVGTVSTSVQIYYKLNLGDAWTAAASGATSVLALNFRYVRVVLTFSATGGANLIGVNSLVVKLANKLRTDSGAGTAAVGGTAVTFNVPFVSADTPLVQPNGATPLIPVVIYAGGANPTGFTVKLYNTSGADVGGTFSWTARGY
jgi:hypothetical protein